MSQERLEASLAGIRQLLSHLHGEITDLEKRYSQVLLALKEVSVRSDLDDLTGLQRRAAFFSKWRSLVEECEKTGEDCGILMIDIDHFKRVNDVHGHPTGDDVIRRVAAMLRKFEAPDVITGRYGGEEFVIAARGSESDMLCLAERIRCEAEVLHGPVIGPHGQADLNMEWSCTLSVGISSAGKDGYSLERQLSAADEALYRAKRKGRNRVSAA